MPFLKKIKWVTFINNPLEFCDFKARDFLRENAVLSWQTSSTFLYANIFFLSCVFVFSHKMTACQKSLTWKYELIFILLRAELLQLGDEWCWKKVHEAMIVKTAGHFSNAQYQTQFQTIGIRSGNTRSLNLCRCYKCSIIHKQFYPLEVRHYLVSTCNNHKMINCFPTINKNKS